MPVTVQCSACPLTADEIRRLWLTTITARSFPDEAVTVQSVSPAESERLNGRYRHKKGPTNVLTFSYSQADHFPGEEQTHHEVVLCLPVARTEAADQAVAWRRYVAWLVVHAFLHVTGLDHEVSAAADREGRQLEKDILTASQLPL